MKLNFLDKLQEALDSGFLNTLLQECNSLGEIATKLGYSTHGRNTANITKFLAKNNLVFSNQSQKTIEYEQRICVHCSNIFQVSVHNKNRQKVITCSHSCSSNYAPFKIKRVEAKIGLEATSYPILAKRYGLNACCICKETEVLDIHHLDEDRNNNVISNLVPLCPTHHAYLHRGKSELIFDKLVEYLDTRGF